MDYKSTCETHLILITTINVAYIISHWLQSQDANIMP